MIIGVGIDICPIDRIGDVLKRHGDAFMNRVYTRSEQDYAEGKIKNDRLAARWAAKEATIKALGAPEGLSWQDIAIENDESGAPRLTLSGAAKTHADTIGVTHTLVSMTHAGGQAVAVVILEGR
ncbi:MAG: holo-ACP synthase [Deltaproteobacteria bacterium]|nr:holo-ACP synthase [Deltaproteobacteria bacterium]MBN2674149.1 holo-ACP synthase [Deltaproteobacteria bacterium]